MDDDTKPPEQLPNKFNDASGDRQKPSKPPEPHLSREPAQTAPVYEPTPGGLSSEAKIKIKTERMEKRQQRDKRDNEKDRKLGKAFKRSR